MNEIWLMNHRFYYYISQTYHTIPPVVCNYRNSSDPDREVLRLTRAK